ncbi:class I SAM-dependent methyltransferase [Gordonia hongkongensis]|uniref:class I SAM-dependent methyltransferase n=1 Tax=Gordonia hongkongensis TaxID=1701090 RepID=UPI003EB76884
MPGPSIAEIFNSTSPDFDLVTPLVWGPAGETLVARARVALGDEVLDICSGTGASALATARVVGPDGHVTAVDFAADLVERGRTSAYAAGLRNIDFRVDDVTALPGRERGEYDVITCGFGVFFLPDMDDSVRKLLPLLRPRGRLAVAVWHDDALHDFTGAYFAEVARVTNTPPPPGPRAPSDGPPTPSRGSTPRTRSSGGSNRLAQRMCPPRLSTCAYRGPTSSPGRWSSAAGCAAHSPTWTPTPSRTCESGSCSG